MKLSYLLKASNIFIKLAEMPSSIAQAKAIFEPYGLNKDCSNLKKVYWRMMAKLHFDKLKTEESLQKMKEINAAYKILEELNEVRIFFENLPDEEDKEDKEVDTNLPHWEISISTYFGDGHGYISDYSRSERDYTRNEEFKTQKLTDAISLIDKELAKGNTNLAIILSKGQRGAYSPRMLIKYDNIEHRWYVVPGGPHYNTNEVETQDKNRWKNWDEAKRIILRNEEEYNWGEKFTPGIKTPLFD